MYVQYVPQLCFKVVKYLFLKKKIQVKIAHLGVLLVAIQWSILDRKPQKSPLSKVARNKNIEDLFNSAFKNFRLNALENF